MTQWKMGCGYYSLVADTSHNLTFWIWAANAAPLLKPCSVASGSERLFREPALLVKIGVGSAPEGSYCWLEGHFPFNTTWQILSRRLIITRSWRKKVAALSFKLPKSAKSLRAGPSFSQGTDQKQMLRQTHYITYKCQGLNKE